MRLTIEQRISVLERENIILQDTIKVLHKMLKEQRQMINDYITQRVTSPSRDGRESNMRPEDAVFTFVCRRRFELLEKRLDKLHKLAHKSNMN